MVSGASMIRRLTRLSFIPVVGAWCPRGLAVITRETAAIQTWTSRGGRVITRGSAVNQPWLPVIGSDHV